MIWSGLIVSSFLVAFAFAWALTGLLSSDSAARRAVNAIVAPPRWMWLLLALAAFIVPVLEYWLTAVSHGNALAGFFPWADAREYFLCGVQLLTGAEYLPQCGKRPFYPVFFADLL